jgi:topoisomerase-4 subunit A
VTVTKGKEEEQVEYDLEMLIDVKGWKAIGNKVSAYPVKEIQLIESEPTKAEESEDADEASTESDDQLEIGTTIDLTPKKDDEEQLGLF